MNKSNQVACILTEGGSHHSYYYKLVVPSMDVQINFNLTDQGAINKFAISILDDVENYSSTRVFTYYIEEPARYYNSEHYENKSLAPCTPELYDKTHALLTELIKTFKVLKLLNTVMKDIEIVIELPKIDLE